MQIRIFNLTPVAHLNTLGFPGNNCVMQWNIIRCKTQRRHWTNISHSLSHSQNNAKNTWSYVCVYIFIHTKITSKLQITSHMYGLHSDQSWARWRISYGYASVADSAAYDLLPMITFAASVGWNASQNKYSSLLAHDAWSGRHVIWPLFLPTPQHPEFVLLKPDIL